MYNLVEEDLKARGYVLKYKRTFMCKRTYYVYKDKKLVDRALAILLYFDDSYNEYFNSIISYLIHCQYINEFLKTGKEPLWSKEEKMKKEKIEPKQFIIVKELKHNDTLKEIDNTKFLKLRDKAQELGFLNHYSKGLMLCEVPLDKREDKNWLKLIRMCRKFGFMLHYSDNCIQFTAVIHKRHLRQFTPYNYMRSQRETNGLCLKDLGFDCCINLSDSPDKSLCDKCKLNKQTTSK